MKKVFLLLIVANFSFAQEFATTESGKKVQLNKNGTYTFVNESIIKETILTNSDFSLKDDYYTFISKPYYILNGDDKLVNIDLIYSAKSVFFKSINAEKISFMISMANLKTKYSMKNKRTYVPRKVTIIYSESSNTWMLGLEYISQNDYGANKDGDSYVTFEKDGTFKSILIP